MEPGPGRESGTHCGPPHAVPGLGHGSAGFGLDHLRVQGQRRDVLSGPGLHGQLIGHLERLSQRQDDLIGLRLETQTGQGEV